MSVKKKLCELCNSYYDDLRYHLKGSEHQENAHNNKRFASLDALIQKGPTATDLLR